MSSFIYCLNSSTIRTTPILEKIRVAAEAGYAGIELWHDDMDTFIACGGTLEQIRRAVDDHGLKVPTTIMLKGWSDTTGAEHQAALDDCRRRLEQAQAVGAEFAVAGPCHGMVDMDAAGRNYRELLEIGLEYGVKPSMEYLGFAAQINRLEDALEIVQRAGHPAGTVVIDPFHFFRGGGSLETLATLRPEQIAMSHFNDAPADPPRETQRDPDRVMPGDGIIDLATYVRYLKTIGYHGYLSLELFREDLWEQDPLEVAKTGLERMRAVAEA